MSLAEVAGSAEKKKIYRINTGNVSAFPSVLLTCKILNFCQEKMSFLLKQLVKG